MALMKMLNGPVLRQWVPAWVEEQYTRANPYFREVLTAPQPQDPDGGEVHVEAYSKAQSLCMILIGLIGYP